MVKVGQTDLKGELVSVPLDQIIEDVPVDRDHVRELSASIRIAGQLAPLVVWKQEMRIIDGFHRAPALRLAGRKEANCLLYSCDEETFWNLRIVSAKSHQTVHFARVVEWVQHAFASTPWSQKMRVEEAFRVGTKGAAPRKTLTPQERIELSQWVVEKSQYWSLSIPQIGKMLRIAEVANSDLVRGVRDERGPGILTPRILQTISNQFPRADIQHVIVAKVREEKLSLRDVEDLVPKVAAANTEEERERILRVTYQPPKRGRPQKSATAQLQKVRSDLVSESLRQLKLVLPELEAPQTFDELLSETFAALAIYQGGSERDALSILQRENQSLKRQLQQLSEKLDRRNEDLSTMRRRMGSMQEEIDTLRRRN